MKENKETQKRVDYLIDRMSGFLGIKIPKREYPLVVLTNENSHYNADLNYFKIRESDKYSGEVLGHELGGFFREKLKQQKKQEPLTIRERIKSFFGYNPKEEYETEEIHAHEFFDYLGTRILQELIKERKAVRFGEKREPIEQTREYRLHHARPSKFARQLDLSKIEDYKALFSLPDKEVRYRFFRSDPQYDLSRQIQPGTITKRHIEEKKQESGLETALKFIGTVGIFVLFALSINTNNLTGYAINIKKNPTNPDFLIFILLIVLLILGILNQFKLKKRRK